MSHLFFKVLFLHLLAPGCFLGLKGRPFSGLLIAVGFALVLVLLSWTGLIFLEKSFTFLLCFWVILWLVSFILSMTLPPRNVSSIWGAPIIIVCFWGACWGVIKNSSVLCGWQLYSIPTSSMVPALNQGDIILANTRSEELDRFFNGEILIFHHPRTAQLMIKRVVALEGDVVSVENQTLLVNGAVKVNKANTADKAPYTLQEGELFMLGDNYNNSIDSRYWGVLNSQRVMAKYAYTLF